MLLPVVTEEIRDTNGSQPGPVALQEKLRLLEREAWRRRLLFSIWPVRLGHRGDAWSIAAEEIRCAYTVHSAMPYHKYSTGRICVSLPTASEA